MKIRFLFAMLGSFMVLTVAGCGGGGGGSSPPTGGVPPVVTQPVTATLKVSTQGVLTPGSSIGAVDLVVTLPTGVTVKAAPAGDVQAGVVVPSGVAAGSTAVAVYTPATGAAKATVRVAMINATGFGLGEFVTVNCDIAATYFPQATDFGVALNQVVDLNSGNSISGLAATFSADIK